MATAEEIRAKLAEEKLSYMAGLRQLEAKNWDRLLPVDRFSLDSDPDTDIFIFNNGSFRASDERVYRDKARLAELFEALRSRIGASQAAFFEGYDKLQERENEFQDIFLRDEFLRLLEEQLDSNANMREDVLKLAEILSRGGDTSAYLAARRKAF